MATLEGTGNFRREQVSVSGLPQARVTPEQTTAKKQVSGLASDIEKIFKGASQTTEAIYKSSQYADTLLAMDKKENYVKTSENINKYYADKEARGEALTVQDYKDKREWQNRVFKEFTQSGVTDDMESNIIFKENFFDPMAKLHSKQDSIDSAKQAKRFVFETKEADAQYATTMKQNIDIKDIELRIARGESAGISDYRKSYYREVANSVVENFKGINVNEVVDAINNGTLDGLLDKYMGKFLKYDEDGNLVKTDDRIDDDASKYMKDVFESKVSSAMSSIKAKKTSIVSTIPDANSTTKIDGNDSFKSIEGKFKTAEAELKSYVSMDSDFIKTSKYKTLAVDVAQLGMKSSLRGKAENAYNQLMVDLDSEDWKIAYSNYLGSVSSEYEEIDVLGNKISMSLTKDNAVNIAKYTLSQYESLLSNALYDDIIASKRNPFKGIARLERSSGGEIKSMYFANLSKDINNGELDGDTTEEMLSNFNKFLDYSKEKGTIQNSWLKDEVVRQEFISLVNTENIKLEALKRKETNQEIIKKTEAESIRKIRIAFDGMQNMARYNKISGKNINTEIFKEIKNFDADDLAEFGWTRFGLGEERYARGTKVLMSEGATLGALTEVTPDSVKDFMASNSVELRGGVTGQLYLPFKDAVVLYTQGRSIKASKAAEAIMQGIKLGSGVGYAPQELTDSTLDVSQSKDDAGNIITYVRQSSTKGGFPDRVYSFTLDELEAGKIAY